MVSGGLPMDERIMTPISGFVTLVAAKLLWA